MKEPSADYRHATEADYRRWYGVLAGFPYDKDTNAVPARFAVAYHFMTTHSGKNYTSAASAVLNCEGPLQPDGDQWVRTLEWLLTFDWSKKSEFGFAIDAEIWCRRVLR